MKKQARFGERLFGWQFPADFHTYSQNIWLSFLRRRAMASSDSHASEQQEHLRQWARTINAAPAQHLAQTIFRYRDDDKWRGILASLRDMECQSGADSDILAAAIYRLQAALGMVDMLKAGGELVDTNRMVGR